MNRFLKILVLIELAIILFLFFKINLKRKDILGAVYINPIKKENIVFAPTNNLKYFYEPRPNIKERDKPEWMKQEIVYTYNSDGLNERFDYPVNKPKSTFRIITLGDSHTFGFYVNTKDNWPEQLEDILNAKLQCKNMEKIEVINLGVSGYDIQYSVERFIRRGLKYNPDLVVWFIKDEDFSQYSEDNKKNELVLLEELTQTNLNIDHNEIVDPIKFYEKSVNTSIKKFGLNNLFDFNYGLIKYFRKNVYQNKLIIMSYPIEDNLLIIPRVKKQKEFTKKLNRELGIYFFDGILDIYTRNDLNFAPFDLHPNTKGHRAIAESLVKYLIEDKIIPCNK